MHGRIDSKWGLKLHVFKPAHKAVYNFIKAGRLSSVRVNDSLAI
jgi:hypothetical protein